MGNLLKTGKQRAIFTAFIFWLAITILGFGSVHYAEVYKPQGALAYGIVGGLASMASISMALCLILHKVTEWIKRGSDE